MKTDFRFTVLEKTARPSAAAKRLVRQIRAVATGDWPRLFTLARQSHDMPQIDRLYVLQFYAGVVDRWRPEQGQTDPFV